MKSDDPMAEEILKRTLLEVRSTRARRQVVKSGLAGIVVLMVAVALFHRLAPVGGLEEAVASEPAHLLPPAVDEKIAVMVWRDGTPRLEWVGLHDLGSLELQFSLEPVFAFADDGT